MSSTETKVKILLVEDEPGFRRIYSFVLKNAGYDVLEAEDGEKGIQMVLEHHPDLVLLDLMLPKISGFDVLKKIRETVSIKNTPIIIFSVMGEQREMEHGMNLGANDYAIKGFYTPKDILAKISTALESTDKKSDEKKLDSNSYFLSIDPEQPDSLKLQKAFGLPTGFMCPLCNKPLALELELLPTHSRTVGHWFASHFLCKTCHTDF
jgi:DNA-binding response OmpR family regulator